MPNAGGTSLAFLASEVTGDDALADTFYLTADPPLDSRGQAVTALTASKDGIF